MLTPADVDSVLRDELAQLHAAADTLRAHRRAAEFDAKAAILSAYLPT